MEIDLFLYTRKKINLFFKIPAKWSGDKENFQNSIKKDKKITVVPTPTKKYFVKFYSIIVLMGINRYP